MNGGATLKDAKASFFFYKCNHIHYNVNIKGLLLFVFFEALPLKHFFVLLEMDIKQMLLGYILPSIQEDETAFLICHCGYIDMDLFNETSLTTQRASDVACAVDKDIAQYIRDNDIRLITYRDL